MTNDEKTELIGLLFNESGTVEAQGLLIKAKSQLLDDRSGKMIGRIKLLLAGI